MKESIANWRVLNLLQLLLSSPIVDNDLVLNFEDILCFELLLCIGPFESSTLHGLLVVWSRLNAVE